MAAKGEVVLRGAYVDDNERGAGLSSLVISTWLVVAAAAHIGWLHSSFASARFPLVYSLG